MKDSLKEGEEHMSVQKSPSIDSHDAESIHIDCCSSDGDQNKSQSTADNEVEETTQMLQIALMKAASLSFGIYATEAWVYDEHSSLLVNVGNGLQVHRSPQGATDTSMDALDRISNASNPEYVPPTPTPPGVGLAGVLWSESSRHKAENDVVIWRDVRAIASDPDKPHEERLQLTSDAGFRIVAGIPFHVRGTTGIVLYFANPYAEKAKLVNGPNERYMCSQADLIGSIIAVHQPTKDVIEFRKEINLQNWRYMKMRLLAMSLQKKQNASQLGFSNNELNTSAVFLESTVVQYWNNLKDNVHEYISKKKFVTWCNKCKGGTVKAAPPMPLREVMWTFIGVFLTHLVISRLHKFIKDEANDEFTLVLAPVGSVTALQYALTPAPSAQPRNIILGQILAITIGLSLTHIPDGLSEWVRLTIAPALAIPAMSMLGIPHPPAGATAILFASGEYDWIDLCLFITALCLSIFMAVAINNLSDMRQYPTNWLLFHYAKKRLIRYNICKASDKSNDPKALRAPSLYNVSERSPASNIYRSNNDLSDRSKRPIMGSEHDQDYSANKSLMVWLNKKNDSAGDSGSFGENLRKSLQQGFQKSPLPVGGTSNRIHRKQSLTHDHNESEEDGRSKNAPVDSTSFTGTRSVDDDNCIGRNGRAESKGDNLNLVDP